jgi:hypothetical protein
MESDHGRVVTVHLVDDTTEGGQQPVGKIIRIDTDDVRAAVAFSAVKLLSLESGDRAAVLS